MKEFRVTRFVLGTSPNLTKESEYVEAETAEAAEAMFDDPYSGWGILSVEEVQEYNMGWSQADGGWMIVRACTLEEAEELFEDGDYEIQEDLAQVQRNALERDFKEKWAGVDIDELETDKLREFKDDCFNLYEQTGFLEIFDSPFDDTGGGDHEHNGMRFEVIRRATEYNSETGEGECDLVAMPLWLVRFENGDEALCYPEEIAVIEHED